jgi:hypothetical protein
MADDAANPQLNSTSNQACGCGCSCNSCVVPSSDLLYPPPGLRTIHILRRWLWLWLWHRTVRSITLLQYGLCLGLCLCLSPGAINYNTICHRGRYSPTNAKHEHGPDVCVSSHVKSCCIINDERDIYFTCSVSLTSCRSFGCCINYMVALLIIRFSSV